MSDARARAWYADLHHGVNAGWTGRVPAPRPHRHEYELGELEAVVYRMRLGPSPEQVIRYRHDFEPHARPLLVTDEHGALHNRHGQYTVTTRGITDLPAGERMNSKQITRYAAAPPPPLPNPYARPTQGAGDGELYRNAREMVPYRSARDAGFIGDTRESDAMRAAKIIGTAASASVIGGLAVSRTRWSYGWRGAAQAAAGILAGYFLRRRAPNLAVGLVGYGAVAGTQGLAAEIQLSRYLAQGTGTATSSSAGTTTATNTSTGSPGTAGAAVGAGAQTQPQQLNAPASGLPGAYGYDYRGYPIR